jgi:hypothetical protein
MSSVGIVHSSAQQKNQQEGRRNWHAPDSAIAEAISIDKEKISS